MISQINIQFFKFLKTKFQVNINKEIMKVSQKLTQAKFLFTFVNNSKKMIYFLN